MRRLFRGRRGKLLAAFVVALVLAGGALAYVSATGSGSGSATAGTAQAVTITAGAAPSTPLFPNGNGDVTGTISNPNNFVVRVGRLNIDASQGTSGFAVDGSHSSCVLSALSFVATLAVQNNGGAGWDVPANGTTNFDLTSAVHLSTAAVSACQGATFTVYLQATPS